MLGVPRLYFLSVALEALTSFFVVGSDVKSAAYPVRTSVYR